MESRTKNAEKNILSAVLFQVLNIFLKFVLRTVFIYALGKEYLGINGVFSNILTVLSLSELGLSSAIVYDMYKPIAEDNKPQICALMIFYKKIFSLIGLFVFIVGIALSPFLRYIITDVPNVKHITVIYVMYVINSASSYLFAQYTSIVSAYQKNYIITNNNMCFSIIKTVVEIIMLCIFHSYIVYLAIEIIISISQNVIVYKIACKLFPFIMHGGLEISKDEKKHIFRNALSNFSIKISDTVIGATDNILISMLVSTVMVGLYSNYALIIQICLATTVMFMNAVLSGVGNLCATGTYLEKQILFKRVNFFFVSIYALICVGFVSVVDSFISVWIGEDYILNMPIKIIIIINCVMSGMKQPAEIFISADGLFRYFKIVPLMAACLNILISIILGNYFGMIGVLLGTTISQAMTNMWYYPYIVYKYSLQTNFKEYIWRYLKSILLIIGMCVISSFLIDLLCINLKGIILVGVSGGISLMVYLVVWVIVNHNKEEFKYYYNILKRKMLLL